MRTTVPIDDEPFEKALSLADPGIEKSELLKECVRAFIQRQSARRLRLAEMPLKSSSRSGSAMATMITDRLGGVPQTTYRPALHS